METQRRVNLPTPRTPGQVALDIVNIGGLVEFRALCNATRGDTGNLPEGKPLVSEDMAAWWAEDESEDDPRVWMCAEKRALYEEYRRGKGR